MKRSFFSSAHGFCNSTWSSFIKLSTIFRNSCFAFFFLWLYLSSSFWTWLFSTHPLFNIFLVTNLTFFSHLILFLHICSSKLYPLDFSVLNPSAFHITFSCYLFIVRNFLLSHYLTPLSPRLTVVACMLFFCTFFSVSVSSFYTYIFKIVSVVSSCAKFYAFQAPYQRMN